MSDFGDADPEDAWHPDDPVLELVENLLRRLLLLIALKALAARDQQRLEMLRDDLRHVIDRVRAGQIGSTH